MYVNEDIAISIIMQGRSSNPKMIKFRSDLGFNQISLILKKEQSVVIRLLKAFSTEKIKLQHNGLKKRKSKKRTDMYFSGHKLVVEIVKKRHNDRNQNEENKRQIKIEEHLDYKFHRINPDVESFDIFLEINKIQN